MSKERTEEVAQEKQRREEICQDFSGPVSRVPSYKFIFLGPQLAARLDKPRESFNDSLNKLMLRLSRQHPFHILYQIIPLAGGSVTVPAKSRRASDIKADDSDNGAIGRAEAADYILKALGADSSNILAKIAAQQMKMFAEAATSWSLSKDKAEESVSTEKYLRTLPTCPLNGLVNMRIPVATCPPVVDLTGKYDGVLMLVRYKSTYTILGGIHRPKRMAAVNSQGRLHVQIVCCRGT
jgi:ataxia telangiectasia mutated family protein